MEMIISGSDKKEHVIYRQKFPGFDMMSVDNQSWVLLS